jgi:hypothetical protein
MLVISTTNNFQQSFVTTARLQPGQSSPEEELGLQPLQNSASPQNKKATHRAAFSHSLSYPALNPR